MRRVPAALCGAALCGVGGALAACAYQCGTDCLFAYAYQSGTLSLMFIVHVAGYPSEQFANESDAYARAEFLRSIGYTTFAIHATTR
ncbi:Uncharacterised protein [Mycobacteroides abscessus subsp. abscessus]|nr:Uncharacterised protein [Mycobacteroides abscessus subsp. abscessus]